MTVNFLTSPALQSGNLVHGFFTREGGVSKGLYAGLNCGPGSGDDPAHVAENRRRAAHALLGRDLPLCTLYQVHGPVVATVTDPWANDARPEADALVTDRPGIVLGILTADCGPVLFADPDAGVVGAAHAGWKGAFHGVLEATVTAMEALGARRGRISAALGPTIAGPSYEVDAAFRERFIVADPAHERFFQPSERPGHAMFDLPRFIEARLQALDLGRVAVLGHDTYASPDRFFSYRRATHQGEKDYGRQISLIALK